MAACIQPGLLELLQENNNRLDEVMKCLEAYLEVKRVAFPRFFFLSNDELLEILAQVSIKRGEAKVSHPPTRVGAGRAGKRQLYNT